MAAVFVDSSGWSCLVDPTDAFHNVMRTQYWAARQQGRKVVTTNYVLVELVALLTTSLGIPRPSIIAFIDSVRSSPFIEIVYVDATLDGDAWQLLRSRQDKTWSMVDCASFMVMQRRAITEALTTNDDFEAAGFVRLLK